MSLTSEIVHNYKKGNFKTVTSPPEFVTDSIYLMNHSEDQKKMVETLDSQDKKLLVLENILKDEDSLNLQNIRISNKAIENEEIGEQCRTQRIFGDTIYSVTGKGTFGNRITLKLLLLTKKY